MILTSNHLPTPEGYYFDHAAADRAVAFFEKYLRHSKGKWSGAPFVLEPWQRDDIIRPLFGWKRPDGTRRYRHAYIELPRKNGKSTLAAGLALYLLVADREPGAEVYSCAADREQARIVFAQARQMVENSPALRKRLKTFRNAITYPQKAASYKVLSADAPTKHGLNSSGIIFDELHAQPNRELFDVMDTSIGARTQPIMIMITTAGYDLESVCYEQHLYAEQIANGVISDPSWFVYIAAAHPNDDWKNPATWKAANPGYGVTIGEEYLREQFIKAVKSPAYENTFKRLHLNLWTSQETKWIARADWDVLGNDPTARILKLLCPIHPKRTLVVLGNDPTARILKLGGGEVDPDSGEVLDNDPTARILKWAATSMTMRSSLGSSAVADECFGVG